MKKQPTEQLSFNLNPVLALGPGDIDDGDQGRQQRGMAIAAMIPITKNRLGYQVPSLSGNGSYIINLDGGEPYCSCPDFALRQRPCKHVVAVELSIMREERPSGIVVETHTARVTTATYPQQWSAYNTAQEREQECFLRLLYDLCSTIPQPPAKATGRPRLPLSDLVFAAATKVYGTRSTRRSMTDVRDAHSAGLLASAPSTAAIWRAMEDPALTPVLQGLLELSALPLASLEQDFAIDSTGFGTGVYDHWYDHKWKKNIKGATWVKAHAICGVVSNIITAAEVTTTDSADAPQLPMLLARTAEHFDVREVSGDKAYLSRTNLHAITAAGATPLIPFKSNSVAHSGHHRRDLLWERAFHYFNLQRAEFLDRYHKRSNIETTFSMVKAKFGPAVRSKSPAAQINEVLLKFLAHNICCLIQSAFEMGVDPLTMAATEHTSPATKLIA